MRLWCVWYERVRQQQGHHHFCMLALVCVCVCLQMKIPRRAAAAAADRPTSSMLTRAAFRGCRSARASTTICEEHAREIAGKTP